MKRFMVIMTLYGEYITVFLHTKEAAVQLTNNLKTHSYGEQAEIYEYHSDKGYQRIERIEQEGENENVQI